MTPPPPDPAPSGPPREPQPQAKAAPASVLAAPRNPVTRWNRKIVMGVGAALAGVVLVAFAIGSGGPPKPKAAAQQPQADPDAAPAAAPDIASRFPAGYADPAVQAAGERPGVATLPPPGSVPATAPGAPAPAKPPDPQVQQAAQEAQAARAAGPFFGGTQAALPAAAPAPPSAPAPTAATLPTPTASTVSEVQPANGQLAKLQFAQSARADDYLVNAMREPVSPWEVKTGTIIPAALITALNSDLPGEVIAQVTQPVYDHATGRTILIPQGARLIGRYDSQVAYGQNRALVAWNRIVMPNGRSINIGAMAGADLSGAAGLHDQVDEHIWQLTRGIMLSTLFSVGAASAQDANTRSSGGLVINSAASGAASSAQQVGEQITSRDLNRQPTLKVRPGWPLTVVVNKDMVLAPYP